MDKLLLTVEDAAGALEISRRKLYEPLQAGSVESVHVGACRRVPASAVVDYVERLRNESRLAS